MLFDGLEILPYNNYTTFCPKIEVVCSFYPDFACIMAKTG